ncbi:MAG: putative glycosyltransferase, partial [Mucilaginibacter sp.]|nr:putative glycosyltransferase [Mucilaginibacter sp.]
MKKICFFISSISQAGGTGRVCTNIANKLSELGYEVTILSMYGKTPFFELSPDITVVAAFNKKYNFKLFLPYTIFRLRRKITTINPDILINVDSALFLYSLVSGLGVRFKNIVWEHFNFNVTLNSKVRIVSRRLAALFSDAIVTLTHTDKNNWEKNLNCKAPIFIIN